ncbi:uncharacterized protein LOC127573644 [Pristis pectinata]|uniref:uncharacterized protein LOC127573644 n=1 Tax=Pristis pectinata TaxID=685728 RepID=UPI00223D0410|nr:uncharacterized protein LOC127573644 [Pristis pectinata]
MVMNGSQMPKEELVSNGDLSSVSKNYLDAVAPIDLTGLEESISVHVGEGFSSCDPQLNVSRRNISQLNGPCGESITSKCELYKLQEEELPMKLSNGGRPFTNSQPLGVDEPLEIVSSNVYSSPQFTKVEDKFTQLQVWKEDPHIFTSKCESSNCKQIYVAQSEWEVWDTFEFTSSGSNTTGFEDSEEGRTCGVQILVSTLDATSSQELLSKDDTSQQSNSFDQISTSRNYVLSSQQYVSPYSSLEPLTDSQLPYSHVESDTELPITRNIQEFQYCRWQEIEIRVSYVIDPHYFYIQHSGQELPELMRELNIECSKSSATIGCIPLISSYVCAWLPENKQWYRACVIRIVGSEATVAHDDHQHILVEVLCVDYGFSASLSISHLKILPPTFYALPQQALRVSLANIFPVCGPTWSRSEISWFKKFVKNKTFFARLYQKLNVMTVVLFSERGKMGIMRRGSGLSQKMAAAGLARYSESNCTSPKVGPSIPLHWKQCLIKLLSGATNLKKQSDGALLSIGSPKGNVYKKI